MKSTLYHVEHGVLKLNNKTSLSKLHSPQVLLMKIESHKIATATFIN